MSVSQAELSCQLANAQLKECYGAATSIAVSNHPHQAQGSSDPSSGTPPPKVSALVFCSWENMNHFTNHCVCVAYALNLHTQRHCQTHHHHHCQIFLQQEHAQDTANDGFSNFTAAFMIHLLKIKSGKELLPAYLSAGELHRRFGDQESVGL